LPKEVIELLAVREGPEVLVEIDRQRRQIVISPAEPELNGVDEEFARQVSEFIEMYRPALDALAKGG